MNLLACMLIATSLAACSAHAQPTAEQILSRADSAEAANDIWASESWTTVRMPRRPGSTGVDMESLPEAIRTTIGADADSGGAVDNLVMHTWAERDSSLPLARTRIEVAGGVVIAVDGRRAMVLLPEARAVVVDSSIVQSGIIKLEDPNAGMGPVLSFKLSRTSKPQAHGYAALRARLDGDTTIDGVACYCLRLEEPPHAEGTPSIETYCFGKEDYRLRLHTESATTVVLNTTFTTSSAERTRWYAPAEHLPDSLFRIVPQAGYLVTTSYAEAWGRVTSDESPRPFTR